MPRMTRNEPRARNAGLASDTAPRWTRRLINLRVTARQLLKYVTGSILHKRHRQVLRALRSPPHLRELNARVACPINQPTPSGGEPSRLNTIYLWIALAGLRHVKESFELFELF
jgi:hypothetical protein